MIAKATPKGKSFRAIINYLFKGRLEGRETANKKPTILSASYNLELPISEDDTEGINRLIEPVVLVDFLLNTKKRVISEVATKRENP